MKPVRFCPDVDPSWKQSRSQCLAVTPVSGTIDSVSFVGDRQGLVVSGAAHKPLTLDASHTIQLKAGERIGLLIAPDAIRLLPSES